MSAMSALDSDARLREMGERLAELADRNALLMTQHKAYLDTIRHLAQQLDEELERGAILDDIINEYERRTPDPAPPAGELDQVGEPE